MSDASFKTTVEAVAKALDGAGVLVLIVGLVVATGFFLRDLRQANADAAYTPYRQRIGRTILLSLEFLVAADIIRTVAIAPSLESVAVLAAIVLVRTFLSFTLELEITGRWPWQKPDSATGPTA